VSARFAPASTSWSVVVVASYAVGQARGSGALAFAGCPVPNAGVTVTNSKKKAGRRRHNRLIMVATFQRAG
jgi:hypothetical protein